MLWREYEHGLPPLDYTKIILLDLSTSLFALFQQGVEGMATKINRTVTINGEKRWIHANTEQEYADKLMKLMDCKPSEADKHLFREYALNWFETYLKPNIATATGKLYSHLLTHHIIPAFEGLAVEDINAFRKIPDSLKGFSPNAFVQPY